MVFIEYTKIEDMIYIWDNKIHMLNEKINENNENIM